MTLPAEPGLRRRFLTMLGPMILTNILQAASGTINTIWVGQILGVQAVAVVSSVFPLILLMFPVVIGIGSGASVLIGQAWGARDRDRMRAVAANALILTACLGTFVSVLAVLSTPVLLRVLKVPDALMGNAITYTRILMAGMPALFVLWYVTMISRAVGDAVSPLRTLAVAAGISLSVTPLLLESWRLGLPHIGVGAAAFGSDLACVAAPLWLVWFWRRKDHALAPSHPRHFRLDFSLWRSVLAIGLPTAGQMIAMALAEMALLSLVNQHGASALAAYGAVNQILSWIQFPSLSIGITTTIFASHLIGAGQKGRVRDVVRTGLFLNLLITGSTIACAYLAGPVVLRVFLTDPAVRVTATHLLYIVLWSLLPFGLGMVFSGALRADKVVLIPTVLAIAAIIGVEVPVAFRLEHHLGLEGIWWGYAAGYAAALTLQGGYYLYRHRGDTGRIDLTPARQARRAHPTSDRRP